MVAIGMDGMAFLNAGPFDAMLMDKVYEEALRIRKILDHNLAVEITNNVAKLFA